MDTALRPPSNGSIPRITLPNVALRRTKMPWRTFLALAVILALIAGSIAIVRVRATSAVTYDTVPLARADFSQTVTATGTVDPQNTISIGSQESGIVSEIDVDYNSHVHKGQVLARLDPSTFQASLDSARAALAQAQGQAQAAAATSAGAPSSIANAEAIARAAQANAQAAQATAAMNAAAIASAQSNVSKTQAALAVAQQTVTRDRTLLAQGYIAQSQLDADAATLVADQAAQQSAVVAVHQATLQASASASAATASNAQTVASTDQTGTAAATAAQQSATAAAAQAAIGIQAASVRSAQQNLDRTTITSPVDGTVIARAVTIGQTVAASFQTPTLFTIAQDLGKMEVDLAVGEPDIGNVRAGENVDFTVLAFPNHVFHGTVSQVRKQSVVQSNVVTYTTVVLVDNRDGKLLPGMTANATIDVATAKNAFVVPLTALTYRPQNGLGGAHHRRHGGSNTAAATAATSNAAPATPNASPWGATTGTTTALATAGGRGWIFVNRKNALVRIPVKIVLVNGTQAAVSPLRDATLSANDAIVVGDSQSDGSTHAANTQQHSPLSGSASMRGFH